MTMIHLTGILFILLPLAFNVVFFLLQRAFDYPDILRKSTDDILTRFQQGGRRLIVLWYAFMLASLLFTPVAILAPQALAPNDTLFVTLATTVGVLAGLVQCLGLIRWAFVVPYLARTYTDPGASQATRAAVVVIFQAFHRYAGVAIGEHLGYLFTSLWSVMMAFAMMRSPLVGAWLGWLGVVPAVGIFIGIFEESGFKAAGAINATSYLLWSLWLIVTGVLFLMV
jgi:hypothetical protein